MINHPAVQRFIQLVDKGNGASFVGNGAGFAEYMLWLAVEGKPIGFWAHPEIVTPEIMELLRTLRDDLNIWPFWSLAEECWDTVSVPVWRAFAAGVTLGDLIVRYQKVRT